VSRWAATYWREQTKAGNEAKRAIVNTSSGSGLHGNAGQANYAAAKAGIAAMTIVQARELSRYGVRANAIAPVARTRMTLATPGLGDAMNAPEDAAAFDMFDPANVSPLVGFLATEDCPFNGQVFEVVGGRVGFYQGWTVIDRAQKDDRWTVEELKSATKNWDPGPPPFPMF
jgi:NAD(P)-dependent dehydrogenase (short-subunit alcohol dehydrogenase family)